MVPGLRVDAPWGDGWTARPPFSVEDRGPGPCAGRTGVADPAARLSGHGPLDVGGDLVVGRTVCAVRARSASKPIVVAFSFAFLTGIVFGYLPARKAARLDPIEALARD